MVYVQCTLKKTCTFVLFNSYIRFFRGLYRFYNNYLVLLQTNGFVSYLFKLQFQSAGRIGEVFLSVFNFKFFFLQGMIACLEGWMQVGFYLLLYLIALYRYQPSTWKWYTCLHPLNFYTHCLTNLHSWISCVYYLFMKPV